ncbi:MAG: hypothetical protein Q9O74_00360 [Planctomycetota bacterium]|nr:hypothetical protein [Planctomycetota bacterium]
MVRLWLNLARSGGTLLSRCLGCMEGVMLLSEVHPLGVRVIDPAAQAAAWHKLLRPGELEQWAGGRGRYDGLIALLVERAEARGKTLLLRDWSHLDYLGVPITEPGFASRSMQLLGATHELRCFATVRHPADQWASQQRLDMLRGRVDVGVYLRGCRAFAELAAEVGFVRFEDFTREPDAELLRLCEGLGVAFDPTWRMRYRTYANVTGDEATKVETIGEIRPARRHGLEPSVAAVFAASEDYAETCRLLGYDETLAERGDV